MKQRRVLLEQTTPETARFDLRQAKRPEVPGATQAGNVTSLDFRMLKNKIGILSSISQ